MISAVFASNIWLAPAASATTLPTTISSNTTLTATASPYTATDVTIASGVTVTVEPGVVVKLSGALNVNGTLAVNASAASPAIFTSSADSAPNQWGGITFNSGSGASVLDHAEVRYAGYGITVWSASSPQITNSIVRNNAYQGIRTSGGVSDTPTITANTVKSNGMEGIRASAGSPEIANNTVLDNAAEGIYYQSGGSNQGIVKIHDNDVERNGGQAGIRVYNNLTSIQGQTLSGNTVRDNAGDGILFFANMPGTVPGDIDENTLTGNGSNATWVSGYLAQTATWDDRGYPIVLQPSGLTIPSAKRLTLSPGLILKGGYYGGTYQGGLTVDGELDAQGTFLNPIVMTSVYDDSVGGDTNRDGAATYPRAGDWAGVAINSGSTYSKLDNVGIGYAKYGVTTNANTQAVTNSVIHDNLYNGIRMSSGSPQITGNTVRDNGMSGIEFAGGSGSPEIANNTILRNYPGTPTAYGGGIDFQIANGKTAQVNIHDNDVESNGNLAGIRVWQNTSGTATGASLGGNTLRDNTGEALRYQTTGPIPTDIDSMPAPSGNGKNALFVSGQIASSTTLEDHGYPYVIIGGYDLAVNAATTLTLDPGVVVKGGGATADLSVAGTLSAEGTAAKPITFTSLKDDSAGGDTNGDGGASTAAAGDWGGIVFDGAAGTGTLDRVDLSYGGASSSLAAVQVRCTCPSPPTIRHAKVRNNVRGLYVSGNRPGDPYPIAAWSEFSGNTQAALDKGGTQVLSMPHNSFSPCDSGPKPVGCGDFVGQYIDTTPRAPVTSEASPCPGKSHDCPTDGDPVALATGAFTYDHTDLTLANKSGALTFARAYTSADATDTGLGPGWSQSGLALAGELEAGDVLIRRTDGRRDLFTKTGSTYAPPPGVHDTLVKLGSGAFRLTTLDRAVYDFRADGRIAKITDDHGLQTTYNYDANGRLASITDPSGQSLTFAYNAANHITKVSDSAERQVAFTYTTAGDLDTVTDALGGITDYGYDAQRRLQTIKDPRGVTFLANTYDGQGRVSEQRDALGNLWTIAYASGQTTVTEPEGGERTYAFDGQLRVSSVTDELGHATSYSYDAAGNVDQITRPGGGLTALDYDSAGNLLSATDPEGGQRSFSYDSLNRLTGFTDERSKTWAYTWNSANDLIEIEDPDSETTEVTYNSAGQPLTITDPNNHTTTLAYGTHGVLASVTDPLSHQITYGYDAYNQLTSITRPGLAAETYTRSKLGDLLSLTTPEGHATSFGYDANGALTSVTDPATNQWQITRDAMERPTAYTDPLLHQTTIDYDGNGNPTSIMDRTGDTTTYDYDLANQMTEIDAPATAPWQFGYDARGNRDRVIDPRGNETDYYYDLADRLIEADEPLSTNSSYDYDPADNLTALIDPNGHTTTFDYDDVGRLEAINQPLSKTTTFAYDPAGNLVGRTTPEDSLTLAYDGGDRLTSISDGTSILRAYGYDNDNRLISATDAQSKTIDFGYDDDGNLAAVDDDRGQTVSRGFDSRGNLTSQTDGRGTISYAYDELNRMTSLTDPNTDVIGFEYNPEGDLIETDLPNGVVTSNSYDDANRMLHTSSANGAGVLQSFDYVYDDAGNRTSQTDRNNDTTAYAYDPLNRLSQFDPPAASAVDYGYDDAGNRTQVGSTTYDYNALNELVSDSTGNDYTYDGAGRLTGINDGSSTTAYSWDALDQLADVDDGSSVVSYSHDGLGRRSERTIGAGTETAHYGDRTDLATLDTDSAGVLRSWLQGPGGLVEQHDGAATRFPLPDAHGDVTTLADNVGAVASRQEYDPSGEQLAGPALEMGWLGAQERRAEPTTELVQMGIRSYAPMLGRFLSEDPVLGHLGLGASLNRTAYVWNNPLNSQDLHGRDWCPDIFSFCEALEDPTDVSTGVDLGEIGDAAGAGLDALGDLNTSLCPSGLSGACEPPIETAINGFQDFVNYVLPHVPCHEIGLGFDAGGVIANSISIGSAAIPGAQGISGTALLVGGGLDLAGVGFAMLHEADIC